MLACQTDKYLAPEARLADCLHIYLNSHLYCGQIFAINTKHRDKQKCVCSQWFWWGKEEPFRTPSSSNSVCSLSGIMICPSRKGSEGHQMTPATTTGAILEEEVQIAPPRFRNSRIITAPGWRPKSASVTSGIQVNGLGCVWSGRYSCRHACPHSAYSKVRRLRHKLSIG